MQCASHARTPCEAAEIERWDDTADADSVVGFGAALPAEAWGRGARDRSRPGGRAGPPPWPRASSTSAGGTPVQIACGFEDSLDDMFLLHAGGLRPTRGEDRPLLRGEPGYFDRPVAREALP